MYRFAPSPTGDMHIGNLRAAIFNYICSLQDKSGFTLRIEDTDKQRNIEGKDEEIKEILKQFGIKWDYLYYQSKNLKFHHEFASKLLMEKKAFNCFCTKEELEAKKQEAKEQGIAYRYDESCANLSDEEVLDNQKSSVIRIKKPTKTISFDDLIKGEVSFEPENIGSFVILREDKSPTYNFACSVDDMLQGITCIIRGEDHVSNTPKQEHIRKSLGYDEKILYAHLPIILNAEGKKMSKRENSSSVKWLLQDGFLPEAIANYLILLGNKMPKEIFTLQEAVEFFDIKKISKSPAKFDIDKLMQINREHLRLASKERIQELFGTYKSELVKFYTQEASKVGEIKEKIEAIYSKKEIDVEFENEALLLKQEINKMQNILSYEDFKKELMEKTKLKGKKFFMPLRLLLTNKIHGPEMSELFELIKDDIKEIINK